MQFVYATSEGKYMQDSCPPGTTLETNIRVRMDDEMLREFFVICIKKEKLKNFI